MGDESRAPRTRRRRGLLFLGYHRRRLRHARATTRLPFPLEAIQLGIDLVAGFLLVVVSSVGFRLRLRHVCRERRQPLRQILGILDDGGELRGLVFRIRRWGRPGLRPLRRGFPPRSPPFRLPGSSPARAAAASAPSLLAAGVGLFLGRPAPLVAEIEERDLLEAALGAGLAPFLRRAPRSGLPRLATPDAATAPARPPARATTLGVARLRRRLSARTLRSFITSRSTACQSASSTTTP